MTIFLNIFYKEFLLKSFHAIFFMKIFLKLFKKIVFIFYSVGSIRYLPLKFANLFDEKLF